MKAFKIFAVLAAVASLQLAACSNTVQGVKQDTRENVNRTGKVIERTGEAIQKKTE